MSAITAKASRKMKKYAVLTREPRCFLGSFDFSWEQRKAKELFVSTADKGYPELPVLSATQDRGMIRRDENSINIFHDKKNEAGYKRVLPGQFVIHLRSFQGGFAHSAIEGITSPAYTVFGFSEPEKHNSEYWKYVFTSKSFIQRLETVTYGIRDGRSISYEEFLTLGFVYPSKAEQTEIARYLDKLSDLITLHQRQHFLHSTPDISLSVRLIHPFYTSSWEQRKFGEITSKYEDPVPTPHDGYYRLGIRSHAKGTFHSYVAKGQELETAQMHRVAAGNFIVNITFGWEHAVAITDKNDAGKLVSHRFPQFSFAEGMVPEFFRYVIVDEKFRHHLWLASPGGAGRNRVLKLDEMLNYLMRFPSRDEQIKIAEFFRHLDNLITLHQRKGKAAVSGCSNDANNSKGVCCKARDFGYKCHKKDEPNRFDA